MKNDEECYRIEQARAYSDFQQQNSHIPILHAMVPDGSCPRGRGQPCPRPLDVVSRRKSRRKSRPLWHSSFLHFFTFLGQFFLRWPLGHSSNTVPRSERARRRSQSCFSWSKLCSVDVSETRFVMSYAPRRLLRCIYMTYLLNFTPAGANPADIRRRWSRRARTSDGSESSESRGGRPFLARSIGSPAAAAVVLAPHRSQPQDTWGGEPDAGGASVGNPAGPARG